MFGDSLHSAAVKGHHVNSGYRSWQDCLCKQPWSGYHCGDFLWLLLLQLTVFTYWLLPISKALTIVIQVLLPLIDKGRYWKKCGGWQTWSHWLLTLKLRVTSGRKLEIAVITWWMIVIKKLELLSSKLHVHIRQYLEPHIWNWINKRMNGCVRRHCHTNAI